MTNIVCPFCAHNEFNVFLSVGFYRVLKCLRCHGMYRDPYQTKVFDKCEECEDKCLHQDSCFDDSYQEQFLSSKTQLEQTRWNRIKANTNIFVKKSKIMELGTGVGALASLMLDDGADYRGLEGSPFFYQQCLRFFPTLKGHVVNAFYPEGHFHQETFDLIVANDVLQFVPYPLKFLNQIITRLKPDGQLYIEVSNESAFKLRAYVRKFMGLYSSAPIHPGHINFFTRTSLKELFDQAGCSISRLFQISLASDRMRMKMTIRKNPSAFIQCMSNVLSLTRLDLMLQLGNYVSVVGIKKIELKGIKKK
ncbi:MAG: class I SAM-dependent methyltransferase [Candidatus Omnitrophica bacterium]|nr:class I SAM-dependent methyltransferase [Candidatus Omnitrophota bacterium]